MLRHIIGAEQLPQLIGTYVITPLPVVAAPEQLPVQLLLCPDGFQHFEHWLGDGQGAAAGFVFHFLYGVEHGLPIHPLFNDFCVQQDGAVLPIDAGLRTATSCGWHPVEQQKVHEHEALRDGSGRRLYCWLTSFGRSLQTFLRITLDTTLDTTTLPTLDTTLSGPFPPMLHKKLREYTQVFPQFFIASYYSHSANSDIAGCI